MIDPDLIHRALENTRFAPLAQSMIDDANQILTKRRHGDRNKWQQAVQELPHITPINIDLNNDQVTATTTGNIAEEIIDQLRTTLMQLHPWRKGPFNLFGLAIDTEWQSNLKWNRIKQKISNLQGRAILDVGSGNGYYLYRMIGDGANLAIGIDPTELFLNQFAAIQHYVQCASAFVLPHRSEEFLTQSERTNIEGFDTVFSMGVYYHRRNPSDHLQELKSFLKPGGELVLETLVLPGDHNDEFVPENRYAQMRNVWSIPTVSRLKKVLKQNDFVDVVLIDLTQTTGEEQRRTRWMKFNSLPEFLNFDDPTLTIEGHPAPLRACLTAKRPV